jgi:hypothetical protein
VPVLDHRSLIARAARRDGVWLHICLAEQLFLARAGRVSIAPHRCVDHASCTALVPQVKLVEMGLCARQNESAGAVIAAAAGRMSDFDRSRQCKVDRPRASLGRSRLCRNPPPLG